MGKFTRSIIDSINFTRIKLVASIIFCCFTVSCGGGSGNAAITGPASPANDPPASSDQPPAVQPPVADSTRFGLRWHSVIDPYAGNIEAAKLLVPVGWNISGGVKWIIGTRNGGVHRDLEFFSPDRSRGVLFLPTKPYQGIDNSVLVLPPPQGSLYQTTGSYIQSPLNAAEYLSQFVIPFQLNNASAKSEVQFLPEVASALQQSIYANLEVSAARVRVRFELNGREAEGEVHAWLWYATLPDGLGGQTTFWQPERVFMVYAPPGELDKDLGNLYPLAVSEIGNPAWVEVVNAVEALRKQGVTDAIAAAAELSALLTQNANETFELISSVWRENSAVNDKVFDAYSQYIQGVETYIDPAAGPVELPGAYSQAWSNSAGEYIMTNDVLFDPNTDPTQVGNWTLLNPG